MKTNCKFLAALGTILFGLLHAQTIRAANLPDSVTEVDPLVKASAYGDKSVWSYHGKDPMPWNMFKPRDYGSSKIAFSAEGVTPVGRVPAPGVHPRLFFSPEDLPAIRRRIKEDRGAQEAWKNLLGYANAMKLTYDEKADYAKPDWRNGSFGEHGRVSTYRIGGYNPKRENYYALLAAGQKPKLYEKNSPAGFFKPAATEAFRCLIEDDAVAARTLAAATVTAIKLEQERRAKEDKSVAPGQPPRPSTARTDACALGFVYDFIYNWLTPEQKKTVHDELVTLSAWADNYGTFNNAEASRSNWATFSYWVFDLMAIEGEPGFNDLKFLGLYRGWRNFYTYSFFDSGAAYEAEGKLLFGLDAAVAMDRVGWKYGLEPLTQHPLPRSYYSKFSASAMLPTRDSFAVFDILGSMGGGFTTPQDLVVARYLFPQDKTIDFVYRAMVGEDYQTLPNTLHSISHQVITAAIFATAYSPDVSPEKLNLPLSFFCGQRALLMTRSSWDTNATMLTMHVRGASGGHPYPDRNGLMLAAQGRTWVTIPGKDIGGWAMNTVLIDGATQTTTTPGRVVDYVDEPDATFMVGDAKYCWDWVWRVAEKTKQGGDIQRADVLNHNVDTALSWQLLEQSFNDFAHTKSERDIYNRPLKFSAHWIAPDGALSPYMRQVNAPVLKAFRTAGVVRGSHPYVLVVDDVQRDALPCRYDWNLTLPADLVRVKTPGGSGQESDVVLAGKDSLDAAGKIKHGEPALLLRVLDGAGTPQIEIIPREKMNLLSLHTVAAAPDFKVLLYAYRAGDPLPKTEWNSTRTEVSVEFPGQKDSLSLVPSASGKTDIVIQRAGRVLARINRPVPPLGDAASEQLTEGLKAIPQRLAALQKENFNPLRQLGFEAGWNFNCTANGQVPPVAGSAAGAAPITLGNARVVEGMNGLRAVATSSNALTGMLDFAKSMNSQPFTIACWLKTKPDPFMGGLFNVDGVLDTSFKQGSLNVKLANSLSDVWPTAMLSSWTHLVFTSDGKTLCNYRNGRLISSAPMAAGAKFGWGKKFSFGGMAYKDNPEVVVQSLYFYHAVLTAAAVNKLYLWGRASVN